MTDHRTETHSARAQVEQALASRIESMALGAQLPPEPELARELGVSRATLRDALRTFAERGILVRRQGVGTFVASHLPILETGLEVLESLDRMAQRLDLDIEMVDLDVTERAATPAEQRGLALHTPARVLVVDRVIAVAGRPVADLRDVVPTGYLCEDDLGDAFRGSVLDVLLARGTPPLTVSRTELMAVNAGETHAARLAVEPGVALLTLRAQLFTYDERVVDYSLSTFVPGHFRFHVVRQVRRLSS
jgi:GntR family transcriptional regulator